MISHILLGLGFLSLCVAIWYDVNYSQRASTIAALIGAALLMASFAVKPAHARDDGRYANSPLKPWFDQLKSGKGLCCSDADGYAVSDPDWDTKRDGDRVHYRVRIEGNWYDVPDDAVITEPNRAGRTMVWPIRSWESGEPKFWIRCFMPGSMT